jgi:hypothetical protein
MYGLYKFSWIIQVSIRKNGVAFTGEGKLVRRATGDELQNAEAALSRIGFAGCASRARGRHWSVSVTPDFSDEAKII